MSEGTGPRPELWGVSNGHRERREHSLPRSEKEKPQRRAGRRKCDPRTQWLSRKGWWILKGEGSGVTWKVRGLSKMMDYMRKKCSGSRMKRMDWELKGKQSWLTRKSHEMSSGWEGLSGEKALRGTCRPGLPSMKRFTGMWNFGAKTDQVPGKPGFGHPTKWEGNTVSMEWGNNDPRGGGEANLERETDAF